MPNTKFQTGSKSNDNSYGTIIIKLGNTTGLNQGANYDYVVLRSSGGGYYTGYAVADIDENQLALIDSTFTLPDNPPPYEIKSSIEIRDSISGELILNTIIDDIVEYGDLPIFSYDDVEEKEKEPTDFISDVMGDEIIINSKSNDVGVIKKTEDRVIYSNKKTIDYTDKVPYQPPMIKKESDKADVTYSKKPEIVDDKKKPEIVDDKKKPEIVDDNKKLKEMAVIPPSIDSTVPVIEINIEPVELVFDLNQTWNRLENDNWTNNFLQNLYANIIVHINVDGLGEFESLELSYSDYPHLFDIEIIQLLGQINVPYYETTDGIGIDTTDIIGGDTQFQCNASFEASMEELINHAIQLGGYILFPTLNQYLDPGNRVNSSKTITTSIIDIPQYIPLPEEEEPFEESIDEVGIKRDIREAIFELMYDNFIPDLNADELNSLQQTIKDGDLTIGREEDDLLVFTKKDGNVIQQAADGNNPGDEITNEGGLVDMIYNLLTADGADATTVNQYEDIKDPLRDLLTYHNNGITWSISFLFAEFIYAKKDIDSDTNTWINVPNIPNLTKSVKGVTIDVDKANKVLDTNIFELLPPRYQRQSDIDGVFAEDLTVSNLLGPTPPFQNSYLTDAQLATDSGSRISENDSRTATMTRLDSQANEINDGKTIEGLRNTLNTYLKDVDNVVEEIEDDRPEYQNKAEGFLKLRKPNQAIIIRNPDGGELDFQKGDSYLTDGFTITMWVRFVGRTGLGTLFSFGNPYKADLENRYGFRLETFTASQKDRYPHYPARYRVLKTDGSGDYNYNSSTYINQPDDGAVWNALSVPIDGFTETIAANGDWLNPEPFAYSDYERFVRLVVWDHTDITAYNSGALVDDDGTYGKLYDGHFGTPRKPRQKLYDPKDSTNSQGHVKGEGNSGRKSALPVYFPSSEYGNQGQGGAMHEFAFNYTRIPTDNLDEWFFICATYDPGVDRTAEDRAKVEVISRRDLLTARGFKVEEVQSPTDQEDVDDPAFRLPVAYFTFRSQESYESDFEMD